MTEVLLRECIDELSAHLHAGRYADAIALGRHILRYYPKHLETYRLLAEASLESDELADAADLFQRVLGADPENLVALVGLSIVAEHKERLDEALAYLERAFEIQPANPELRKELLRLYGAREGASRAHVKLTPAGLARVYARAGWYPQAIQEFRALLRADPARYDLQVALTETLYRAGQVNEAAQLSQALLEQMPFCLKANLILGALWVEGGIEEGRELLARARALDPENALGRGWLPADQAATAPPTLPRRREEPTSAAPAPLPEREARPEGQQEMEAAPAHPSAAVESPPAKEEPAAPVLGAGTVQESAAPVLGTGTVLESAAPVPGTGTVLESAAPVQESAAAAAPVEGLTGREPVRRAALPTIAPVIPGAREQLPAWLGLAPATSPAPSPVPEPQEHPQATTAIQEEPPGPASTELAADVMSAAPVPPAPPPEQIEPAEVQAPAPAPTAVEPEALLAEARELRDADKGAAAVQAYEKVLQRGPQLAPEVIADLEQFVQAPDTPMSAHRLLGDAYSMVGRYKDALEQYRQVLGR